jgi:hypothetical protein
MIDRTSPGSQQIEVAFLPPNTDPSLKHQSLFTDQCSALPLMLCSLVVRIKMFNSVVPV